VSNFRIVGGTRSEVVDSVLAGERDLREDLLLVVQWLQRW
jgi:hypothetical protein